MKSIAKLVQWNVRVAVVALKESVMQLMKEIAQARVFATGDRNRLEPAMCRGRTQSIPADMEYDMQGMRWQDQVYQNNRKIDRALNRVHRHARPWPNIDIAVVKGMEIFVHPFPVQDPVDNIENVNCPKTGSR